MSSIRSSTPSSLCRQILFIAVACLLAAALLPAAAQQGSVKHAPAQTLFASGAGAATPISGSVCIPFQQSAPSGALDRGDLHFIVLRDMHSLTAASSGPFSVYLEAEGSRHHLARNRLGYFSLYSDQARTDGSDYSINIDPAQFGQLVLKNKGQSKLEVCIENRNPSLTPDAAPAATVTQILLVQIPRN